MCSTQGFEVSGEDLLLRAEGLDVTFRTDTGEICAVDELALSLARAKILGLVGETGCGKSVTGRAILRVLPAGPWVRVRGSVYFEGRDLLSLEESDMERIRGAAISMIFQEPGAALNPTLKIGEQVAEVIAVHQKVPRSRAWNQALDMLNQVGIPNPDEKAHLYPHQLSGGMKQRVMVASAVACRPSLLIADEPTTALDVTIQSQILELITNLRNTLGTSVLLISHDLGIIAETCDEVNVMYLGRIVEKSDIREFFSRPLHPYSRGLLEAVPRPKEGREWLPTIRGYAAGQGRAERCNFVERCSRADETCSLSPPPWFREGTHSVLCFHPWV
jgi:peptide/nickel transport system ATP-binding protein